MVVLAVTMITVLSNWQMIVMRSMLCCLFFLFICFSLPDSRFNVVCLIAEGVLSLTVMVVLVILPYLLVFLYFIPSLHFSVSLFSSPLCCFFFLFSSFHFYSTCFLFSLSLGFHVGNIMLFLLSLFASAL